MVKVKEMFLRKKYSPAGILHGVNSMICFIFKLQLNSYRCLCVDYVFLAVATLIEGFPCLFLICKANARV